VWNHGVHHIQQPDVEKDIEAAKSEPFSREVRVKDTSLARWFMIPDTLMVIRIGVGWYGRCDRYFNPIPGASRRTK